ncbi:MAG: hypothetical protein HY980_02575 [Candidatus Magasanikbacteria bacterium]|nr:hypothetical protein [Candidatus Magasanikbacteria bacterium]
MDKKIAFEIKLNGTVAEVKKVKELADKIGLKEVMIISKKFVGIDGTAYAVFF